MGTRAPVPLQPRLPRAANDARYATTLRMPRAGRTSRTAVLPSQTACGQVRTAAMPNLATILLMRKGTAALTHPARGQAMERTIIEIIHHRNHQCGTSANIVEEIVDELRKDSYVGNTANFEHTTWRWETLGAAPCRRQRGPRTSWTRLRGRLPNLRAMPCRVYRITVEVYMNKHVTFSLPVSDMTEW